MDRADLDLLAHAVNAMEPRGLQRDFPGEEGKLTPTLRVYADLTATSTGALTMSPVAPDTTHGDGVRRNRLGRLRLMTPTSVLDRVVQRVL